MKRNVFVWYFLSYFKASICLRVLGVAVPPFKQRGESATLSCEYELEGGKLYSVKWYRDHEEFYRFMPKLRPPQRAHSLDGVTVDLDKSSARRVHLKNLSLKSRGLYRCEVSKEAPSFHSAQAEAFMEVYYIIKDLNRGLTLSLKAHNKNGRITHQSSNVLPDPKRILVYQGFARRCVARDMFIFQRSVKKNYPAQEDFPRESPRISGHERPYAAMEPLNVNCSSANSFPAPDLQWHIDGQKITELSWLVSYGARPAPQGLLVSTLGLRAPAKPMMQLRCIATLGTHQREKTVVIETNSSSEMTSFSLFSLIPIVMNIRIYDKIL